MNNKLHIQQFDAPQPYKEIWKAMKTFIATRNAQTPDQLWLLEHNPVFTQGVAGKPEHIYDPHNIPIVQSDRGGQITYHGPGQLVAYTLFDLKRLALDTRTFVIKLEAVIINLLKSHWNIDARGERDAPGIYVGEKKIASIGLRVKKHYAYHGIALNVRADLTPFSYINPCGFEDLEMTQISEFAPTISLEDVKQQIIPCFQTEFGYTDTI